MWQLPMKENYVDERVGVWFEFGRDKSGKYINVSDVDGDIFCGMPIEAGLKIIEAQGRFRKELYSILCNFKEDDARSDI